MAQHNKIVQFFFNFDVFAVIHTSQHDIIAQYFGFFIEFPVADVR